MRTSWIPFVVACVACGGGSGSGDGGGGDDSQEAGDGSGSASAGLVVMGNKIRHADGSPFHGRGANLHDTRSCNACSFLPRNPDGVDRWATELIDNWKANLIRFDLSAKSAPYNQYELQWVNLVDDPAYLAEIKQNVTHITSKGAYVLVTLFADPTVKPNNSDFDSEWPSSQGDSNTRYRALAEAFHDNPRVLFGLTNEPHGAAQYDAQLAARYADAIAAIRAVEDAHSAPHHIVVVQGHGRWARDLDYFVANPLSGDQIAYEVHIYDPMSEFTDLIVQPSQSLPMLIGEYGPTGSMTDNDIHMMWTVAQASEVPYIAWAFHQRCPPNLLQDTASDGCGLDPATGYNFPRTSWGDLLYEHLRTPW